MTNDQTNPRVESTQLRRIQTMKLQSWSLPIRAAGMVLILAGLTGCSPKPPPPPQPMKPETLQQEIGYAGIGTERMVNTVTTNATVVALDAEQRIIRLKYTNGVVAP